MSGPPYPRHPRGEVGAIGTFVIGVSPIGGVQPFDPWATIISQYANSPRLDGVLTAFNEAMDQTVNLNNFYDLIWNVATAAGYGLDVWGRIVGVTRILRLPATGDFFGFDEAASWQPFGQAPFFSGQSITNNFALDDANYRTLIYAKAAGNISDGSIPSINAILLTLFPDRGACYVTDGGDMTMTYHFTFPLTPVELAIVEQTGVLPKPVGVLATVVVP